MQTCLDGYMETYNRLRPHQGRGMDGRTPLQAFIDGIPENREVTRQETDDIMAA